MDRLNLWNRSGELVAVIDWPAGQRPDLIVHDARAFIRRTGEGYLEAASLGATTRQRPHLRPADCPEAALELLSLNVFDTLAAVGPASPSRRRIRKLSTDVLTNLIRYNADSLPALTFVDDFHFQPQPRTQ